MDKSGLPVLDPQGTDEEMLLGLQRETFDYFLDATHPDTGLIADNTSADSPSSIAAVGLAMGGWIVGVERGLITRTEAIHRTLRVLSFFQSSHQGTEKDATGYRGFYYHFLGMKSGQRVWKCELSTIDTALFIVGALAASEYFNSDQEEEKEIRSKVDFLYRRIDWKWALNGESTLTHGWFPESGFIPHRWDKRYSEALILYILAMGSPTFPIGEEGYQKWTSTFQIFKSYDVEYLHAGPLFIHQMSQIWLDLRGQCDDFNRKVGFDYFENSKRATHVQRQYCIDNPRGFAHYGENTWGLTASDGPGPAQLVIDGVNRTFYDYIARGAPDDIDDGTVSPWAVVTSLPFSPNIVLSAIRHAIEKLALKDKERRYGFAASFNPTFPDRSLNHLGWVSPWKYGLNQGPIVLMIENYLSGLIWKLIMKNPFIITGMKHAGFKEVSNDFFNKGELR
jgi:hypothetical protein